MSAAIEITSLFHRYGTHRALDDISLSVAPGEVFGFLGPNGAGKTTTIRILLGLIRATGGRASVGGLDCATNSIAVRRRVGYLPGEFGLYSNLTGHQLLRYFGRLRGATDHTAVTRLAERLACDLSRPVRDLSHGNRQKVAMIQAFAHRPDVLILDEPTTGLDPVNQTAFFELVDEARENGRTVFLSSHILSEVERLCSRVAVIRSGVIETQTSIADIRARQVRRVTAVIDDAKTQELVETLGRFDEIGIVTSARGRVAFTVRGSMRRVISLLAGSGATDVTSHEPGLEETFFAETDPEQGGAT